MNAVVDISPRPLPLPAGPELAIVVPTYNEHDNVAELVQLLDTALAGVAWEVVFVDDDSPDGTAALGRQLAMADRRVRCVQRIGRRGLSSACIEGMLATSAPFIAVMDGDRQHDETLLPQMLRRLRAEPLDIVVGSRYVRGGGTGSWDSHRLQLSRLATRLSRLVVPAALNDPMSGFFMIRREAFMGCVHQLSALGFKILVDLFASSERPLRFLELPYTFRERTAGQSKLGSEVMWEFGMLLLDKLVGHILPARFVAFGLIGAAGVLVHMSVLRFVHKGLGADFATGQAAATLLAMVFNFAVNNAITYGDRRLGGTAWLRGLLSFMLICSLGAVANVGIANFLFRREEAWVLAALSGIAIGAVWNYAVTALFTWGRPSRRRAGRRRWRRPPDASAAR